MSYAHTASAPRRLADPLAALVSLALGLLVLAQGGFFALVPSLLGIVLCGVAGVRLLLPPWRARRVPASAVLFVAIALAYLASALLGGPTLTTLSACGPWAAYAGMALLGSTQGVTSRERTLRSLCVLGAATGAAGLLVYAGALQLPEGMVGDRLQGSFQYANAAAAWFASVTLLCLLAPQGWLRRLAALPATSLLLTQSAGGILAFVLVAVVVGSAWTRDARYDRLGQALLAGLLAVAAFVLLHLARSVMTALLLMAGLAAYAARGEAVESRLEALGWQRVARVGLVVLAAALLLGGIVLRARVGAAAASFAERLQQVRDGLALWARHPLLGVGPDTWQYLYRYVQTAPYDALVVHSSYVQILLDAGLVGLGLLLAACVLGLCGLGVRAEGRGEGRAVVLAFTAGGASAWDAASRVTALYLLLHAVLEFDLRFSALACLLAWLLQPASQDSERLTPATRYAHRLPRPHGLACGIACLALCLPLCLLGASAQLTSVALRMSCAQGDHAACQRLYEGNPLAHADAQAQEVYLRALCETQQWQKAVQAYEGMDVPTDASALCAAQAYRALGQPELAGQVIAQHKAAQPFNSAFANAAQNLGE